MPWESIFSEEVGYRYWIVFLKHDGINSITRADGPPLSNFPIIRSHMHPHFAIYAFGWKFRTLYGADESLLDELVARSEPDKEAQELLRHWIGRALFYYDKWVGKDVPPEFLVPETETDEEENADVNQDQDGGDETGDDDFTDDDDF